MNHKSKFYFTKKQIKSSRGRMSNNKMPDITNPFAAMQKAEKHGQRIKKK